MGNVCLAYECVKTKKKREKKKKHLTSTDDIVRKVKETPEKAEKNAKGICEEQNQRNVLTSSTTLSHQTKPTDDVRKQKMFSFIFCSCCCILGVLCSKTTKNGGRQAGEEEKNAVDGTDCLKAHSTRCASCG